MESNVVQLTPRVDEARLLEEVIREAIQQFGAEAFCLALIEAEERTMNDAIVGAKCRKCDKTY